ncbi:unnamed protein product, partial [Meganyctiphanes norvegica]
MSEYSFVKVGKLKLKGEKSKKKHKSKKRKHRDVEEGQSNKSTDTADHGGWWRTKALHEITGSVAIQLGESPMFVRAEDNGLFIVGAPHDQASDPMVKCIMHLVVGGQDIMLVKMHEENNVYTWNMVNSIISHKKNNAYQKKLLQRLYKDGKCALSAANDCFLGLDDDDNVVATSEKAGPGQMIIIRSSAIRECDKPKEVPEEERGKLRDVEINYVKKFQKFQDKRMRLNSEDRGDLRKARNEGALHESLLDRRTKMKADRYCK